MLCFFCFCRTRRKVRLPPNPKNPKKKRLSRLRNRYVVWACIEDIYRLLAGFFLGLIVWGRVFESRVAKGHELPRGVRGHTHPERLWSEYALRCNLVHFETQFWEILQCVHWPRRVWRFFRYSYLYTVMITIFFLGGGNWAFCGGSFYTSNTLVYDNNIREGLDCRSAL